MNKDDYIIQEQNQGYFQLNTPYESWSSNGSNVRSYS